MPSKKCFSVRSFGDFLKRWHAVDPSKIIIKLISFGIGTYLEKAPPPPPPAGERDMKPRNER
jgi:hypothetical protein